MILQFKCERLHQFLNSNYIVNVYNDRLTIGNKNIPKYEYYFSLDKVLYFYVDELKLQGFGINYKGKIKFFKATHKDIDQLRNISKNLICFDNITELYKQLDRSDQFKVQDQLTQSIYSIKCVNLDQLKQQVPLVSNLSHCGIIQYRECFKYKSHYYIITDYIGGITLENYIQKNPKLSHLQCQAIILQLLKSVKYLHDHYVIHATINIQQIIYRPDFIKITDFSQAKYSQFIDTQDVQNLGLILFQLYTGNVEQIKESHQIYQMLLNAQAPKLAQELILQMISEESLSISQILNHQYFQDSLTSMEKKKRFQQFQRVQRSTSEMDDFDALSQQIPEFITNKSSSLRQFI